ncbi:hypothetical protein [Lutispora sp.]|uniref:hypothetical protein n=1 Tax=Lutispora sp. TaxID=2828727 RepID=UPI002B1FC985|nr:hypothetical protein [Lutispora sp.]MEA4961829.1 hypothetical protein [Lutispora sp.]
MIKKLIFISICLTILSFLFSGCTVNDKNNKVIQPTQIKKLEAPITQNEFVDAFTLLINKLPEEQKISGENVQKELYETGPILSLYINGDTPYIVSWIDGGKVLIFFKAENSKKIPLYMNIAPIKGVKLLGDQMENGIRLVEVTSYGASGSNQRENVKIFAINGNTVISAWDYDTLKAYSHPVEGKNLFEFVIETSSFSYSPAYYSKPGYDEKDIMRIVVNETKENITTASDDLNKVLSNKKTASQKLFVWNSTKIKFIEKE